MEFVTHRPPLTTDPNHSDPAYVLDQRTKGKSKIFRLRFDTLTVGEFSLKSRIKRREKDFRDWSIKSKTHQ